MNDQAKEASKSAAEEESAPPKEAGPITVKLRKAVIANGEEVMELKFREPTAADIERCGNQVNIDFFSGETPRMSFEPKNMSAMMSTLAAVPPSTIRQM